MAANDDAPPYPLSRQDEEFLWAAAKFGKMNFVVVIGGKKTPRGTTGQVFWFGKNKFGPGYICGFKDDDGEAHFEPTGNLHSIDNTGLVPDGTPPVPSSRPQAPSAVWDDFDF